MGLSSPIKIPKSKWLQFFPCSLRNDNPLESLSKPGMVLVYAYQNNGVKNMIEWDPPFYTLPRFLASK